MKTLDELKLTPKQKDICNSLNFMTSEDIIRYYPFRYEKLEVKPYVEWSDNDKIAIEGKLVSYPSTYRFNGSKTITRFKLETDEEIFEVSLFNRPWINTIPMESKLTIIGKYAGNRKITALNYNTRPLSEQLNMQPVYSLKGKVKQKNIYELIKKVFTKIKIEDDIPLFYRSKYHLLNESEALKFIHFPNTDLDVKQAYRSLKYEEFLKFHLTLGLIKNEETNNIIKNGKVFNEDDVFGLANRLSFVLTNDQLKAINEIISDLKSNKIMYRLVQGDVGCGKTLVAALGLYACILSGKQAAFMAPTEILAKQHYHSLKKLFRNQNIKIEVLYSSLNQINKKDILTRLRNKEIDLLVGTHALFQNEVCFNDLGMVVADEQHRFGVEQRRKLKEKGDKVDFLLMSATPIPRTLASTLYGDMDISTIETMPNGRLGCETILIKENSIISIIDDMKNILKSSQQIYIVCAAIEENENYDARNVTDIYNNLSKEFKDVCKIGLLHGKMNSSDKEKVMDEFSNNDIQILVSTTVIEVGINVVNATCMIVYDAHRFGLSQLHQLRGRVQRGNKKGKCYLLTDSKDSLTLDRLNILVKSNNGFEIAYEDLKLRGPGDILGTRQSGLPSFILGNLVEDKNIIEAAKKDSLEIIANQNISENKLLIDKINQLNKGNVSYYD